MYLRSGGIYQNRDDCSYLLSTRYFFGIRKVVIKEAAAGVCKYLDGFGCETTLMNNDHVNERFHSGTWHCFLERCYLRGDD